MRTLTLVAIGGLATSVLCFAVAAAVDLDELRGLGFGHRCRAVDGSNATTRDLPWDGDDEVAIDVPATVHYRPDGGAVVIASGPPEVLGHLRIHEGRIYLDCGRWDSRELDLVLPGRPMRAFTLNGKGRFVLENLNQPKLKISLNGKGDVKASGTAENVDLRMQGSGSAHLGDLTAQSVGIRITGRGDAEIAPREEADLRITGAGEIKLLTQPRNLKTRIAGAGRIINAASASAP